MAVITASAVPKPKPRSVPWSYLHIYNTLQILICWISIVLQFYMRQPNTLLPPIHALLVTSAWKDFIHLQHDLFRVCAAATLHPNIKDTHHIVCKTSCDLVAFLVPAHFKDSTVSTVRFYDLGVFHRPYIQASIQWPGCQVLTVWAKCDRVNRIPGFKIEETPMSTNRNSVT